MADIQTPGTTHDRWVAVILAAGYGSLLHRDIVADSTEQFTHLINTPKALLPVGGVPLLDHWLRSFRSGKSIQTLRCA